MNKTRCRDTFPVSLIASALFLAATVVGCDRPPHEELEGGGGRVTRTHPAQRAIGLGLGIIGAGARAIVGGRSETQDPK